MGRLTKKEFMKKYNYSPSTYQRRMAKLKGMPIFCEAYKRSTAKEVWIDIELYEKFLDFLAYNRLLTQKISPEKFLKINKEVVM